MKIISHRGNLSGKSKYENEPSYIMEALSEGYDVEVDVWKKLDYNGYFLGHDEPIYPIDCDFLRQPGIWGHAKNLSALCQMGEDGRTHFFWHENDRYTLTSRGYIWTYPGGELSENSICVLPETSDQPLQSKCYGTCSDYPIIYKSFLL